MAQTIPLCIPLQKLERNCTEKICGLLENKTKYFRLRRYDEVGLISFSLISLNASLWEMGQSVLAPQNIDWLGTACYRDMLNIE